MTLNPASTVEIQNSACAFVRLTGCNLRCSWCDTEYAFHEGRMMAVEEVAAQIIGYGCDLAKVTGGEPLLQPAVHPLIARMLEAETS